jgi:PKHD-type hydroxylase
MFLPVANLLSPDTAANMRATLAAARFEDGRNTAGWHAKLVKNNMQLSQGDPCYPELRETIEQAVRHNSVSALACRPKSFGPILFSRSTAGHGYGRHVDDALMGGMRMDISFTVFLSEPTAYEGGELLIETAAGGLPFKLPAGSAVFYPSTTLHRVETVRSGERLVAAGWIRSFIRDPGDREILFDLDTTRQSLFRREGKSVEFDLLSKCLSNLLHRLADD